jgi:hypothetical protein
MKIQRNIHGQFAISILNQEELRAKWHQYGNTFFKKTSDILFLIFRIKFTPLI